LYRLLLAVLLSLAAILRIWAANWGAPYVYHPDEHSIVHAALNMVREGDPNPRWFHYPSLLIYLQAALVAVLQPFVDASLITDPAAHGLGPWDVAPEQWPFVYAGRIVIALFGVAGIGLMYAAAAALAGPAVGLAAAAFIAMSPLHNESSHYLTTDVAAMTWITLALFLALRRCEKRGDPLIAAGFVAGLAASTKYPAGMVLAVPVILALRRPWPAAWWRLLWISAAAALGFLLTSPFALLDAPKLLHDMAVQRQHYMSRGTTAGNWRFYLSYLWNTGLGPLLSLYTIAAMVVAVLGWKHPRRRIQLILVLLPLAYLTYLTTWPLRFERNLMPILPFAACVAADLLWRAARRLPRRAANPAFVVLVSLACIPGLRDSIAFNRRLQLPDTRTLANEWVTANLPAGARLAREEYTPQIDGRRFDVVFVQVLGTRDYGWYLQQKIDYLVLSSNIGDRFRPPVQPGEVAIARFYQLVSNDLPLVAEFTPNAQQTGPRIRIYQIPHL
jgi:4-amino-4-deoxy-L-arabinose transferase-like glycosyltransferase